MAGCSLQATPSQAEASGWWEASCSLSTLHHWEFLPKLIPLAQGTSMSLGKRKPYPWFKPAILCGEVGMPPRVPYQAEQDLQRCMAPIKQLDGDEIVEASLLGPTDDRPITPLTTEEEAVLLGNELEPKKLQRLPHLP